MCWKHVLWKCVLLPGILAPEGLAVRSCSKDEDRQLHLWSLLLSPLKRFRQACAECCQTNRTQGYVCPGFGLLGIFFFFLKFSTSVVKCQILIRQRLRDTIQFQAGFRARGALLWPSGVCLFLYATSVSVLQDRLGWCEGLTGQSKAVFPPSDTNSRTLSLMSQPTQPSLPCQSLLQVLSSFHLQFLPHEKSGKEQRQRLEFQGIRFQPRYLCVCVILSRLIYTSKPQHFCKLA